MHALENFIHIPTSWCLLSFCTQTHNKYHKFKHFLNHTLQLPFIYICKWQTYHQNTSAHAKCATAFLVAVSHITIPLQFSSSICSACTGLHILYAFSVIINKPHTISAKSRLCANWQHHSKRPWFALYTGPGFVVHDPVVVDNYSDAGHNVADAEWVATMSPASCDLATNGLMTHDDIMMFCLIRMQLGFRLAVEKSSQHLILQQMTTVEFCSGYMALFMKWCPVIINTM